MSSKSVTYDVYINGNVVPTLMQYESAANRVDSAFSSLQKTAHAIGTALFIGRGIEFGKEWLQGAADYEVANVRIKNVSSSIAEGVKNQLFISNEADKFKIDLQKATDGYGEFLTMIRGSGLVGSEIRKLHDEVLTIGKVTGIQDGQMDAAVRNLGKLLEQGTLEGRHLRPLTYQLSGLAPYITEAMGLKTQQEFERLLSSGKLTKAAIKSDVLLEAIENYSRDLGSRLPESLNTLQSALNETGNEWLRFKNQVGGGEEFRGILESVRETSHWLRENGEQVISWTKLVVELGIAWQGYKLVMGGVASLQTYIFGLQASQVAFNRTSFVESIVQENVRLSARRAENLTIQEGIALRQDLKFKSRLAHLSEAEFLSNEWQLWQQLNNQVLEFEANMSRINYQAGMNAVNANMTARTVAGLPTGAGIAGKFMSGVGSALSAGMQIVGVAWIASEVLERLGAFGKWGNGDKKSIYDYIGTSDRSNSDEGLYRKLQGEGFGTRVNGFGGLKNYYEKGTDNYWWGPTRLYGTSEEKKRYDILMGQVNAYKKAGSSPTFDANGNLIPMMDALHFNRLMGANDKMSMLPFGLGQSYNIGLDNRREAAEKASHGGSGGDIASSLAKLNKSSKIRGNSVTTINITTGDLIGVKTATFSVKGSGDTKEIEEMVGTALTKVLTAVVNDSQQIADKR